MKSVLLILPLLFLALHLPGWALEQSTGLDSAFLTALDLKVCFAEPFDLSKAVMEHHGFYQGHASELDYLRGLGLNLRIFKGLAAGGDFFWSESGDSYCRGGKARLKIRLHEGSRAAWALAPALSYSYGYYVPVDSTEFNESDPGENQTFEAYGIELPLLYSAHLSPQLDLNLSLKAFADRLSSTAKYNVESPELPDYWQTYDYGPRNLYRMRLGANLRYDFGAIYVSTELGIDLHQVLGGEGRAVFSGGGAIGWVWDSAAGK